MTFYPVDRWKWSYSGCGLIASSPSDSPCISCQDLMQAWRRLSRSPTSAVDHIDPVGWTNCLTHSCLESSETMSLASVFWWTFWQLIIFFFLSQTNISLTMYNILLSCWIFVWHSVFLSSYLTVWLSLCLTVRQCVSPVTPVGSRLSDSVCPL